MMNKKIIAVATAGLGSLLLIGTTGSAFAAEVTPTPSSSATAQASTQATPRPSATRTPDPAKLAQREANSTARKAVHATFKAAVEKAKADYQAVLATNPTDEAKTAAKAARKAAVESARATHLTAMQAINPNWMPHAKGGQKAPQATPSN
jgi:hypothetical protein